MINTLFAPEIDNIVKTFGFEGVPVNNLIDKLLKDFYKTIECVKIIGGDELREIWIEVERGPIEAFGEYEDFKESGEVENFEEFEQMWNDFYPEPSNWYKLQTARYEGIIYIYFGGKLIWKINENSSAGEMDKPGWNLENYERFAEWLLQTVVQVTTWLKNDIEGFNAYIQKNLPWSKRFGKIRRSEFWTVLGTETFRPDLGLGAGLIERLKKTVAGILENPLPPLEQMTADKFFSVCEMCYDANNYFREPAKILSPREKYQAMADGRHDGLNEIEGADADVFHQWYYHSKNSGGHPWEICQGGNSTHISLQVHFSGGEWKFYLAGSSIGRVEETARMAVALFENKVPFELRDAEAIVRMVTGEDFIGIVPDTITPRYCHSLFPAEDKIIDFMNIGSDREFYLPIAEQAVWYPLERVELVK